MGKLMYISAPIYIYIDVTMYASLFSIDKKICGFLVFEEPA